MTKQMGRTGDFCRAVRRGGIGGRSRSTWHAPGRPTAPGCRSAISVISCRCPGPRRARQPPCGRTTGRCSTTRRRARRPPRPRRRGTCQAAAGAHPGRGRHASIAATRAASTAGESPRSPTGSTRWTAAASPASPRSRRCSSTRRRARSRPTPNLATLERAAEALARAGRGGIEINAPGTTSSAVLAALAEAGATQVEPGHGLHGTTPLHALEDLPELPAVRLRDRGLAPPRRQGLLLRRRALHRPGLPATTTVKAIVAREPTTAASALRSVEMPPPCGDRLLRHDRRTAAPARRGSATPSCSASAARPSSRAPTPSASRASPPARRWSSAIDDALRRVRPTGRYEDERCMTVAAARRAPRRSSAQNIRKEFGGVVADRGFLARRLFRRGGRAGRRQRRRQVDAGQDHLRRHPPTAGRIADRRRRGDASPSATMAQRARHPGGLSGSGARRQPDRST